MARTISEIKAGILLQIAATPVLSGLSTGSTTSLFSLVAAVVATVHNTLEKLFDSFAAYVEAMLLRAKPGTANWYAQQMLLFQQGDELVADDEGIHYTAGSAGARVITRATAKENDQTGQLFIKVATDGTEPGTLAPLPAAVLTQALGYIDRKRFAGTKLQLVSRVSDYLRVEGQVYYDPLLELEGEAGLKAKVAAAVAGYLASLEFDGLVFLAKIYDAIQAVPGVKDVLLTSVSARSGQALPVAITRVYETQAGYIVTDPDPGAGPVDTLQFLPYGTV